MSYENTDERIEKLERTVAGIVEVQRLSLNAIEAGAEPGRMLLLLFMQLGQEHLAFARVCASNPAFGDAKSRQMVLDIIARSETRADFMAATIAHLGIRPPAPPAPPAEPN
jgi:hypothetical protein